MLPTHFKEIVLLKLLLILQATQFPLRRRLHHWQPPYPFAEVGQSEPAGLGRGRAFVLSGQSGHRV